MIVLIWVFGFFSFLALVVGTFREDYIHLSIYGKTFQDMVQKRDGARVAKIEACLDSLIATLVKKESDQTKERKLAEAPKAPKRKKLFLDVVPHTSRFNLAVFFKEKQEKYKAAAVRFLRPRLGDYTEQFIQEMVEKGKWLRATSKPDPSKVMLGQLNDLAKVPFTRRDLVYKALKEPLQTYVLFEPERKLYKISVHYASSQVLEALVDDHLLAEAIITARQECLEKGHVLRSNKKTRISYTFIKKEDLEELFKEHGKNFSDYAEVLDCEVHDPHRGDLAQDAGVPSKM